MVETGDQASGDRSNDSSRPGSRHGKHQTPSRRRLLGLLGAGGLAGIAGCSGILGEAAELGPGGTPSGPGDDGETNPDETPTTSAGELQERVRIGVRTNIIPASETLDWYLGYYTRALEPLVWISHDMENVPWLAKHWKRTGKRTWEFVLRENVTFHNGEPLTADAVIATLNERLEKYSWAVYDFNLPTGGSGLEKIDDRTIEMTTAFPTPDQASYLSHMSAAIHHPDSSPLNEGNSRADAVGTGPFQIESVEPDEQLTLSAYDDYWGGSPESSGPHVDELIIRTITDNNTRTLALKGNKIDIGQELPSVQREPLNNRDDTKVDVQPDAGTTKARLNLVDGPTADRKFRKAINYAVSQKNVIQGSQNGLGIPARGPIPTVMAASAHESLPTYGPDKSRAKELLAQSSYSGETVQIVGMEGEPPSASLVAQIIQQEASAVGIDAEVHIVGRAGRRERERTGEGHLFMETKMQTTTSPFSTLNHWLSSDIFFRAPPNSWPTNNLGETLPDVQTRLEEATERAFRAGGDERGEHLKDIQHILVEDAAVMLPLFHPEYLVGMRSGVTGVDWHPQTRQTRVENLKFFE